ncbi:ATP-dependent Clp protease adaptor ClpS [Aeoliella sp.]|uniref:ATP-dependent Clp protease adaptor ClpS n=1 Tax=Aeoliella sp. TaxID=2795800 RepID=UPI003CCBFCB4
MDDIPFEDTEQPDDGDTSTVVAPKKERKAHRTEREVPKYHVVLWDSDDHTFDYVEKMLRELFGHTKKDCEQIAKGVDEEGRAIVLTTTKEHAELKRDQIHAYGKDNLEGSKGSMWATIESAD